MNTPPVRTLSLQRALLATVAVAILAGLIPAGIALDRRLAKALESRARIDLSLAGRVLADRNVANAGMMMMRAKDFAHAPGLAEALQANNRDKTLALVERARPTLGSLPVVVGPDGKSWTGPDIDSALIAETRLGKMPVVVRRNGALIQNVALAPVISGSRWVGAVGLLSVLDADAAGILSGLTRSDVVILSADGGMLAASTLDSVTTRELIASVQRADTSLRAGMTPHADSANNAAREVVAAGERRLVVIAPLGDAGLVLFTRALPDELAVLPELRRVAFVSALVALLIALSMGALLAARVARPVQELSVAAEALTAGEFAAPLPNSRIREVQRVSETFGDMRQALAQRLAELRGMNEVLTDRNARLSALQADLMQRDRLTATGRLVAQLAHEIRNPVANLRNCLEIVRQHVEHDEEAREFTDLAIDELLRMHELAEQMLDLNRPRDAGAAACQPVAVAREVARLATVGHAKDAVEVSSRASEHIAVALAPDTLKQVLLNLVQNAREAMTAYADDRSGADARVQIVILQVAGDVAIEVHDSGPGVPDAIANRIFDPFFTTKDAVHGLGLGLFVAEGLIRTAGGRLSFSNKTGEHAGAIFRITLPAVAHTDIDAHSINLAPSPADSGQRTIEPVAST